MSARPSAGNRRQRTLENKLTGVTPHSDGVIIDIETPRKIVA
jgi:hypothetical protein